MSNEQSSNSGTSQIANTDTAKSPVQSSETDYIYNELVGVDTPRTTCSQFGVGKLPSVPESCKGVEKPTLDTDLLKSFGSSAETVYLHRFSGEKPYQFPWGQGPMLHQEKQNAMWPNGGCCSQPFCPSRTPFAGWNPNIIQPPTHYGSRVVIKKPTWIRFFKECWIRKIKV